MDPVAVSNSSYVPSARDLLLVVPRLAQRAGSFALYHMPEAVDNFAGKIWSGGSIIADATGQQTADSTITNTSNILAQSTAAVLSSTASTGFGVSTAEESSTMLEIMLGGLVKLKNFGGIFSYLLSRWALMTFVVALVLNRTQFYASSRQALQLRWHVRLALYLIPMCAFITQTHHVLEFMRCQTSPDYAYLRWNDPLKTLAIEFGAEAGFIYKLSRMLLFWEDDATCCDARSMSLAGVNGDMTQLRGSISLLFWFFVVLCTSQFFETLACALQGKQPVPETGMTIFEHSLAFAECEAMLTSALGLSLFDVGKAGQGLDVAESLTKFEVLQRLNVPPEVLLICLISCFSHLSSAILAVSGIRNRVRLVNTGIWSLSYMAAFVWSFLNIVLRPVHPANDVTILRFPTVCIVGFIPHVMILVGIIICSCIYGVALIATTMSVPGDVAGEMTLVQRFHWAYQNLQANIQFTVAPSIRIKMSEDFYTTLLKVGFAVLTAASEAVYLNEGNRIHVAQMTWLERKRLDELTRGVDQRKTPRIPPELLGGEIAKGLDHVDTQHAAIGLSPYARERKSRPTTSTHDQRVIAEMDTGLGIVQRRSRMQLTYDYVAAIFWLILMAEAQVLLGVLRRLGITWQPAWLAKAAGLRATSQQKQDNQAAESERKRSEHLNFWMIGEDGVLTLPKNDDVDVEVETRRRLSAFGASPDEDHLSDHLYRWWRTGGWFGNADGSGEYHDNADDDTTSMVSMSTSAETTEWDTDEDDGRRTPTQDRPYGIRSRDATPAQEIGLDLDMLSRLLNPQSPYDKEEARLLSYSLQADRPTTRSQYRRYQDRDRTRLLTGLRGNAEVSSVADDDELELERLLLAQREKARAKTSAGATWQSGAEGMGEGGPQCVVCQSTPRTVLVWPCGCLSMCDDCRVGLAARNYTKCICCRSDVAAYSRLYVP